MVRHLNQEELLQALAGLEDGWTIDQDQLTKTFELRNFRNALAFVMSIGERAEEMNHHPEITIRFN
jgi:4a-hydroxytetrahydrobiopterin dehydratase